MKEKLTLTGVILLGGESKRFGSPKAFLSHQGRSLAATLAVAMEAHLEKVIFVGKNSDQVPPDAKDLGSFVSDEPGFHGPLGGLAGALAHTPTPWIFLTAVDMPFFKKNVVEEMWKIRETKDAVVPHLSGYWQPLCALWNKRVLECLKASPWKSFQYLLDQGGLPIHRVEEPLLRSWDHDLLCVHGFNTPEEWEVERNRLD